MGSSNDQKEENVSTWWQCKVTKEKKQKNALIDNDAKTYEEKIIHGTKS